MYLGKLVEVGDVDADFERHATLTQALLSAIPIPDPAKERGRQRILLKEICPRRRAPPKGCRFVSRCPVYETLTEGEKQVCDGAHPGFRRRGR